jgi:hypothetical protein
MWGCVSVLSDGHIHGLITQNRPCNNFLANENWRLSTGRKEAVKGLFCSKQATENFFIFPLKKVCFFQWALCFEVGDGCTQGGHH